MMSEEMDEIWALYADDGAQALDAMESALMTLGRDDGGAEPGLISALFRAVHTFKGNSRVLGLAVVESRAHLAEDLIGLVRDEGVPFDAELRQLLLLTADTLRTMLEETAATHADVDPGQSDDLMLGLADKIARCRAGSAPPPPPERQPVVVIEAPIPPAPTDEPVPQAAVVPATAVRRLADDPVYRDIFRTMANEAMTKLRAALAQFAVDPEAAATVARAEADGLGHAARQMGLDEWFDPLSRYAAKPGREPESLAELLLHLDELSDPTKATTADQPQTPQADVMFAALREPLAFINCFGAGLSGPEKPDHAGLVGAVATVCDAVAGHGFVRVTEAAERLVAAEGVKAYRAAELRLYEELAAVEATLPEAAANVGFRPRQMLQTCCADNVFETLVAVNGLLDRMRTDVDPGQQFGDFERAMRIVFHACSHFKVESAAELAMSLVDLFARKHAAGSVPDPILIHIARRFVETVELVFDAVGEGDTPDTGTIERLFQEAANASFTSSGLMSAGAIERRLGLPKEFHRVLSPESVRAASGALDRGLRFYVIRTDINEDEKLAEAFLDWISTGETCAITNVTVFQGNRTLFDFLIATPLCESDLTMALAGIDPDGQHVRMDAALSTQPSADAGVASDGGETHGIPSASVTSEMLEQISEISAGQSMVNHMLTRLAEADLSEALYSAMRLSGNDWERAREEVRRIALEFTSNLRDIALAEAHLSVQMAQLQRETVAIRSRPAATVFRSLETFVGTRSRRNGREAGLTASGGDCLLDITLLDSLRKVLRGLVTIRLDQTEAAPRAFHIALHLDEERVLITIEDDGGPQSGTTLLDDLAAALRRINGSLRGVPVPGGGMRFHIVLPLSMRVLEGMVVGVEGVRYIVPVEAIRAIVHLNEVDAFRVAADQGRKMVRISPTEIVAVHSLTADGNPQADAGGRRVYVVLGSCGQSVAIPVDELVGQQLVLLRPLRGVLTRLQNLTGLALLSGGEVGLVLSANRICAAANDGDRTSAAQRLA